MKVQLKVISGSKSGQLITINLPQFLIGRAEDCHLKPRSELISRYHCAILSEEGYVAIRDLGSKNGVFHNGHRVSLEEELKNGDKLLIGPLEFEVVLSVPMKGDLKPKIGSIQDVVARVVEQNNVVSAGKNTDQNVELEISSQGEVSNTELLNDSPEPSNAGEATVLLTGQDDLSGKDSPLAETKKVSAVQEKIPEKASSEKSAILKPALQKTTSSISSSKHSKTGDASDWLFDDGEGGEGATQTYQVTEEDDFLSDIKKIDDEDEKKEPAKKPEESGGKKLPGGTTKTGPAPKNTSDAAANLLKNFFKGGR